MTYPSTPGFMAHSATSREAADSLSTASIEAQIADLLDVYDDGYTGEELQLKLIDYGHAYLQAGTVTALTAVLIAVHQKNPALAATLREDIAKKVTTCGLQ